MKDRHEPVRAKHLEVTPRPGEAPERFVKRFTKRVRFDGVLQEAWTRRSYEKPSQKRRRKAARAEHNRRSADLRAEKA